MGEATPKSRGKTGIELRRHHTSPRSDERCRYRPCAGPQINDKITGTHTPRLDQLSGQSGIS